MSTVNISIGHDDNLVVADFFQIEGTFLIAITNACANGGNHRLNFLVLQGAVKACLLNVDDLAS